MAGKPVVPPPLNAHITVLVDWLELVAFFNEFDTARLDELQGALTKQGEEQENIIHKWDAQIEQVIEAIESEIYERETSCKGSYPFELSKDAEELVLKQNYSEEKFSFYLVCLFASHLGAESLFDFDINEQLKTRLRNRIFQVISTFAMAGLATGSAASIGWPRETKERIIKTLKRAEERGAGFKTRDRPGEYASPRAKDGGIDVISWSTEDRPPPTIFYYAQVASGKNWEDKPVKTHVDVFEGDYFDDVPRSNKAYVTLIPFRVTCKNSWMSEHLRHGAILDRTRLPHYAMLGLNLKNTGTPMDETNNIPQVLDWIEDFKKEALTMVA